MSLEKETKVGMKDQNKNYEFDKVKKMKWAVKKGRGGSFKGIK